MNELKRFAKKVLDYVRPNSPFPIAVTAAEAMRLTERTPFSSLLNYRDFLESHKMVFLDDGKQPSIGFILLFNPLLSVGSDSEEQLESVIGSCPPDTTLQWGVLCTPQIESFVNRWTNARLAKCTNPLLKEIAAKRRDFMMATAIGPSMLPKARMHPRIMQYYLSVRVPYTGDLANPLEMDAFLKNTVDLRNSLQGILQANFIGSEPVDEIEFKYLMREILNPQMNPSERLSNLHENAPLSYDIVDKKTRITVQGDGTIGFSSDDHEPEVLVTVLTVDAYPQPLTINNTANSLGSPLSSDERINSPFWAYTNIHVMHPDKSKDSLSTKLGVLNKQTMSDSAWYRSMMGHLYERKDGTDQLLAQVRAGKRLVRAYSGINVYNNPDEDRQSVETVKGIWRRAGFRLTEEKYISLPVFLASLPLQYSPTMDPPNKGLQRATLMHSLNAASLAFVQGDWPGTGSTLGGPLFVSRRGQLACFDLLQTQINYNFVIVAASGSGKSFLANELCVDFLSKNGIVRLIDVGRSYWRFCEVMGGQNMVFSPQNPVSMNPFSGIQSPEQLNEMIPMLKAMLRQMAYPLTPEEETPPWEYAAIEAAILGAWQHKGEHCDLRDVYDWLINNEDKRAADLAFQLEPYAVGRYSPWFNGPRKMSFDNDLVVIELEELKQDSELQSVILALVIHQVTKEMYLSGRERPKLLAIDEAWDLLGGVKTGKFIETAFRRARKYNGIAGVITQSFEDFEKSAAAKAAIENAAWQFILYQRPESLDFATKHGRISGGQGLVDILKTVRSGPGYSEIYVRGESGSGLYRFVTDRHSYYTFTTNPKDINRINEQIAAGKTLIEAIDTLAREDYMKMWGVSSLEEMLKSQQG